MARSITVRGEGILLDALLAAEFGPVAGRSLLTTALELNPGLAGAGTLIAPGAVVVMPDRPSEPPARAVVSLFG